MAAEVPMKIHLTFPCCGGHACSWQSQLLWIGLKACLWIGMKNCTHQSQKRPECQNVDQTVCWSNLQAPQEAHLPLVVTLLAAGLPKTHV